MKTVTWNLTLDDRPLDLRVEHSRSRRELTVWVDGFPTRRESLPEHLHPRHVVELELDGHPVAIVLVPEGPRLRYEVAIDGRSPTDGTPLAEIGLPVEGTSFLPGQLTFDADRYYALFPRWPRTCLGTGLTGAVLTLIATAMAVSEGRLTDTTRTLLMFGFTALITGIGWWWSDLQRHQRLMSWGNARPALVVATHPVRLAVSVDLAVNDGDYAPAVVIIEQPYAAGIPTKAAWEPFDALRLAPAQDADTNEVPKDLFTLPRRGQIQRARVDSPTLLMRPWIYSSSNSAARSSPRH